MTVFPKKICETSKPFHHMETKHHLLKTSLQCLQKKKNHTKTKVCWLLFSLMRHNTQRLQVRWEEVYFSSEFVEISFHSWLAPRQSSMAEGLCRKGRAGQVGEQRASSRSNSFFLSLFCPCLPSKLSTIWGCHPHSGWCTLHPSTISLTALPHTLI